MAVAPLAPAMITVVSFATTAGGSGEESVDLHRRSSSQSNSSSHSHLSTDVNRSRRGYPVGSMAPTLPHSGEDARRTISTHYEGNGKQKELNQTSSGESSSAGYRRRHKLDSTSRPPYATVLCSDSPGSAGSSNGGASRGGGDGRRGEAILGKTNAVRKPTLPENEPAANAAPAARAMQPRRPSGERRSKLVGGRNHVSKVGQNEQEETAAVNVKDAQMIPVRGDGGDLECLSVQALTVAPPPVGASTTMVTKAILKAIPLPEGKNQSGNGNSNESSADASVLVSSSATHPGVDMRDLATPKNQEADFDAGKSVSMESPTRSSVQDEYAGDVFESDGEVALTR